VVSRNLCRGSGENKASNPIMKKDYIPARDSFFAAWLLNFATLIAATPAAYGLTAPDAVVIGEQNTAFQAAYTAATDPSTRTKGTVAAKDVARAAAELIIRPYAVRISQNNAVTDEAKADVGVTIRKTVPTPIPAPVDAPNLGMQSLIPGQLTAAYNVVGQAGKAKPEGAVGIELVQSIGTVFATDPSQCALVGTYTKSPLRVGYVPEDSGKKVTLFARFVTRSGPGGKAQSGPWSLPLQFVAP
jgi:hypothetical protein